MKTGIAILGVLVAASVGPAAVSVAATTKTALIAFQHGPSRATSTQIWVMNPDGSGERRLVSDALEGLVAPRWSPDGKRIAFLNDARTPQQTAYVADARGKNRKPLLPSSVTATNGVAWSQSGKQIAFTGQVGSDAGLYVVAVSGGKPNLLVRDTRDLIAAPVYAPNGKQIAYTTASFDGSTNLNSYRLWVVNADGSHRRLLHRLGATYGTSYEDILASAWSPDGKKIAVPTGTTNGTVNGSGTQIAVMNADGTGLSVMTDAPGWNLYPSWSPDGTRIVFSSSVFTSSRSSSQLFVMNANGSDVTQLTHGTTFDLAPSWQPR